MTKGKRKNKTLPPKSTHNTKKQSNHQNEIQCEIEVGIVRQGILNNYD
jgi:hypothetical protein